MPDQPQDILVITTSPDARQGEVRHRGRTFRCAVGKGGLKPAADKREGDGASPIGRYPLRQVFYRPDHQPIPQTCLPVTAITPTLGWCDDPADPAYNRLVTLPHAASHERLWRDDHLYDLVLVLGHNDDPPRPDLGSAIFLHVARPGYLPTEGCVALAVEDVRSLLQQIRPNDQLEIMITPA